MLALYGEAQKAEVIWDEMSRIPIQKHEDQLDEAEELQTSCPNSGRSSPGHGRWALRKNLPELPP